MIILTGDSHINALRHGAAALESELKTRMEQPLRIGALGNGKHTLRAFSRMTVDGVSLTEKSYAESFRRLSGSNSFQPGNGVTYGICLGFHSPPVFRHPMWERSTPPGIGFKEARVPISSGALEAIVRLNNEYIYLFLDSLRERNVNFFVISSPPPRPDHYCLERTPRDVVIDVDRAFRSSVQQHLQSREIRYAMPPAEVYDEEGFLRDDLAQKAPNDFHHGNPEYGRIFMRSLFLQQPEAIPGLFTNAGNQLQNEGRVTG